MTDEPTPTTPRTAVPADAAAASEAPARPRRSPLAIVLVASLVAAGIVRQMGAGAAASPLVATPTSRPVGGGDPGATRAGDDFRNFNSYTLGLLLGGLRGPLVMTLWSSTESQKASRDLEDINTRIELIRLLQPNFDTVHIFQIWNKAYNLSVQMSNLPSKYAMILDAIDYARKARIERPDNINIEVALASVYADKLGNSSEKAYYRERVRQESEPPQGQTQYTFPAARREQFTAAAAAAGMVPTQYTIRPTADDESRLVVRVRSGYESRLSANFGGQDVAVDHFEARRDAPQTGLRQSLETVLDADGRILRAYRDPSAPIRQVDDVSWHPERGELEALGRFQPFTYGVSPLALAYNGYVRAVQLQSSRGQSHAQLSNAVLSARPAVTLVAWAEEERVRALRAEIAQFNLEQPADNFPESYERPASKLGVEHATSAPLIEEAIFDFGRAASVSDVGVLEIDAHDRRFPNDVSRLRRERAELRFGAELSRADAAFLRLKIAGDAAERDTLRQQATASYQNAIDEICRTALAFDVPDGVAAVPGVFPKGFGKADALNALSTPASFPRDQLMPTLNRVRNWLLTDPEAGGPNTEIETYVRSISRAQARLASLAAAPSPSPLVR